MKLRVFRTYLLLAMAAVMVLGAFGTANAGKPTITKPCVQCHEGSEQVIRGKLTAVTEKFSTLQVGVGKIAWVIKYSSETAITGAKDIASIPKGKEVAVEFTGGVKDAMATLVRVKQPYVVPPGKLATLDEMIGYVQAGPEKGDLKIIDCRPTPKFLEGHIPHAVSLPYAGFEKLSATVLPKDKNTLLVFYCGGAT